MPSLIGVMHCGVGCLMPVLGALFTELVIYVSLAFIVVAVADFAYQKFSYIQGLKMSKDEVKREYKESEGNPEIKSRRRSLFQEIISSQETSNIRRSSVIVANPVHLAVGLFYERDRTPLPVVTLKEQGLNARRVVAIAEREDVPVMVNVPLAQSLMNRCRDQPLHSERADRAGRRSVEAGPGPLTSTGGRTRYTQPFYSSSKMK